MRWAEGYYPNLADKFFTRQARSLRYAQGRGADEASAPTQTNSRLFLQVDVLDVFDGEAQESLSQAAELFGGVGGEKLQAGRGTALFRGI